MELHTKVVPVLTVTHEDIFGGLATYMGDAQAADVTNQLTRDDMWKIAWLMFDHIYDHDKYEKALHESLSTLGYTNSNNKKGTSNV